jgi:hypothetical protein
VLPDTTAICVPGQLGCHARPRGVRCSDTRRYRGLIGPVVNQPTVVPDLVHSPQEPCSAVSHPRFPLSDPGFDVMPLIVRSQRHTIQMLDDGREGRVTRNTQAVDRDRMRIPLPDAVHETLRALLHGDAVLALPLGGERVKVRHAQSHDGRQIAALKGIGVLLVQAFQLRAYVHDGWRRRALPGGRRRGAATSPSADLRAQIRSALATTTRTAFLLQLEVHSSPWMYPVGHQGCPSGCATVATAPAGRRRPPATAETGATIESC